NYIAQARTAGSKQHDALHAERPNYHQSQDRAHDRAWNEADDSPRPLQSYLPLASPWFRPSPRGNRFGFGNGLQDGNNLLHRNRDGAGWRHQGGIRHRFDFQDWARLAAPGQLSVNSSQDREQRPGRRRPVGGGLGEQAENQIGEG